MASCESGVEFNKRSIHKWNGWGEYIWGEGANVIKPCGQELIYWMDADKKVQKGLIDKYLQYSNIPYKPIYIKFKGHSWNEELEGFASKYNRLMHIEKIFDIRPIPPYECKGGFR